MIENEKKNLLASFKTKIMFEYKKNYSLDKQVKNIVNRTSKI